MRILYLVPYTPTPIRTRPYNLIRGLARRGHQVTAATLWEDAAERRALDALREQGVEVLAAPLAPIRKAWNLVRALPTRTPLQAAYCWQPALAEAVVSGRSSVRRNRPFDVVHVEHLRGTNYGLRAVDLGLPTVWDSVDCISYLFEQAARYSRSRFGQLITRLELPRTRRYEGWLVGQFDRVLITSEVDKDELEKLANQHIVNHPSPISVLPNGVDLTYFCPDDTLRDEATVVFSGKMSYHANVTAALHLVNDIMPLVWAQRPDVQVWIVGKDPPGNVQRLTFNVQHVTVTGTVPDLRPYLRRATVAAVPILYGAGIQNKALEAMACGTPVVVSRQAVAALAVVDGEHALVADGPGAFAQAVLRLLDDAALRVRLGAAGRAYVQAHHDWGAIAARLEEIYRETIAMRSAQGVPIPGGAPREMKISKGRQGPTSPHPPAPFPFPAERAVGTQHRCAQGDRDEAPHFRRK